MSRDDLIEKEAKRRCKMAGEPLDKLASSDRRFRHDDHRFWWDAMFSHAVAFEIEKLESAGFTVSP